MKYLFILLLSLSLLAFAQDNQSTDGSAETTPSETVSQEDATTPTDMTTDATAATEEATDATDANATEADATETVAEPPSFLELLSNDDRLSTLALLLAATDFITPLEGGSFTIFAPTNYAFNVATERLAEQLSDPQAISDVLMMHIVEGTFTSADLNDGDSLNNLTGGALALTLVDGNLHVNDTTILEADVQAGTIVIHVVDNVFPPASAE